MIQKKRWYIIQTYSGYENSVKDDLMRRVDSMGMNDFIFSVVVPEETIIEKKEKGGENFREWTADSVDGGTPNSLG